MTSAGTMMAKFRSWAPFHFGGNFISLSSQFWYHGRYQILYMTGTHSCRGMCKSLLLSNGQQWNYSKAKFPSNLNYGQKIISETGPRGRGTIAPLVNFTITENVDFVKGQVWLFETCSYLSADTVMLIFVTTATLENHLSNMFSCCWKTAKLA